MKNNLLKREIYNYTETISYAIEKTVLYLKSTGAQYFNPLNMSITYEQFLVLSTIYNSENIGQRELSKLILKDHSNTSKILAALEEQGFIKRNVEIKGNRMVKQVCISESGKEFIEKASERLDEEREEFYKYISKEELENLQSVLYKLGEALGYIAKKRM